MKKDCGPMPFGEMSDHLREAMWEVFPPQKPKESIDAKEVAWKMARTAVVAPLAVAAEIMLAHYYSETASAQGPENNSCPPKSEPIPFIVQNAVPLDVAKEGTPTPTSRPPVIVNEIGRDGKVAGVILEGQSERFILQPILDENGKPQRLIKTKPNGNELVSNANAVIKLINNEQYGLELKRMEKKIERCYFPAVESQRDINPEKDLRGWLRQKLADFTNRIEIDRDLNIHRYLTEFERARATLTEKAALPLALVMAGLSTFLHRKRFLSYLDIRSPIVEFAIGRDYQKRTVWGDALLRVGLPAGITIGTMYIIAGLL